MTDIYEYISALHQGIWEVVIPKELVSNPLGAEWKYSPVNVPSHETIASYRNGQYHLHETENEYRIHLDRYDPEKNPILHLIDDAPLILMIYETLQTIYYTARDAKGNDVPDLIKDQRLTWKYRMIIGSFLVIMSGILFLIGIEQDDILFNLLLPAMVFIGGFSIFYHGMSLRRRNVNDSRDILNGFMIMVAAVFMSLLWELYLTIILLILTIWFFTSAYVTLKRLLKEKRRVSQGVLFCLAMGVISLVLGCMTILSPNFLVEILVFILAVIVGITGIAFLLDGYGLRNVEHLMGEKK